MLKEGLKEYRNTTEEMINAIGKDDLDLFEELLEKRQSLIEHIEELGYEKSEFQSCVKELGILDLESNLTSKVNNKRDEYKKEIQNVKRAKAAHRTYNSGFINNSHFFKEKI